jgi:hypothetical protein
MIIAAVVVVVLRLVVLHAPGGAEITINPSQVISLRTSREGDKDADLLTKAVECILATSDGKIISVVESCNTVRKLFEEAER